MPHPLLRSPRLLAVTAAVALAASLAAGCESNRRRTSLVPTGLQPRPDVWPGTVTGTIAFSPAVVPDLGIPPTPPVRIELWSSDTLAAVDSIPAGATRFSIGGLRVGTYTVVASAPQYVSTSLRPFRLGDYASDGFGVDVGEVRLRIRPTLRGRVVFDPTQAPELAAPPFPVTTLELTRTAIVKGSGGQDSAVSIPSGTATLGGTQDRFEFVRVESGTYTLVLRSRVFQTRSVFGIDAPAGDVDIGDVRLTLDPSRIASSMQLVGDINAYETSLPSYMGLSTLGLWLGPNLIAFDPDGNEVEGDTTLVLAPGTYSFRFMANGDLSGATGYGGDGSTTPVDIPVQQSPVRLLAGSGSDLRVRVSSAGRYRFFLDERRQTFSAVRVPGPGAAAAGRPIR
jgi:hypothetical protein